MSGPFAVLMVRLAIVGVGAGWFAIGARGLWRAYQRRALELPWAIGLWLGMAVSTIGVVAGAIIVSFGISAPA